MSSNTPGSPALLSYAFRPFFILNGLFAVLAVLAWVLALRGMGLAAMTPLWHAHELLLGFVLSAVAGFSLTAVAQWTGRPAVRGTPLAGLLLCWLLGRLAMSAPLGLAPGWVAVLDMLFPLLLCLLFAREVVAARNRRNYKLIGVLALIASLNGLYHLGAMQWLPGADRLAIFLLIHTVLLLVGVVAGRIIPSFTGNWLRQQGVTRLPENRIALSVAALSLSAMLGLAASLMPAHALTGVLAFLAALAHGLRLMQWRGFATTSNPLLFVLHAAYGWLPLGYFLLGLSVFGWWVPPSSAIHALTMGAIASMVLAVTTRVSLGHTGRPLQAARITVLAYWLLLLAVVVRVVSPLLGGNYLAGIELSATAWMLAFGLFLWVYWPILSRPRVD